MKYLCESCNTLYAEEEKIRGCDKCDKDICAKCEVDYDNSYCKKCDDAETKKYAKLCMNCERPYSKFGGLHELYPYGTFCAECYEDIKQQVS